MKWIGCVTQVSKEYDVSIDWLPEYKKKFEGNTMIANLKREGFHGKVVVNFCNGSPNTTHLEWCVKPYTECEG